MFCRKCGKQIPDDSEFCYKCGARVEVASERSATDAVKSCFAKKYKETETKPAVSLEKEKPKPSTGKTDRRICPNCGKEIPSPMWKVCPHCNEKLPRQDKSPELENEEVQSRYKKALTSLEYSNDINILKDARDTFHSLGDSFDSRNKALECQRKIDNIRNNSYAKRCAKCGAGVLDSSLKYCPFCSEKFLPERTENSKSSDNADKINTSKSEAETEVKIALQNAICQVQEGRRVRDSNTPVVLVNVNIITKIISYVALGLGLLFEFVIARNVDVSTYDGIMNHNMVVIFSYVFYGIFLCCLLVRIICALIISGKRGELKGTITFIVVGLIITIILGSILKSWWQGFVLFGIIAMSYIGNKIRDWM